MVVARYSSHGPAKMALLNVGGCGPRAPRAMISGGMIAEIIGARNSKDLERGAAFD
jgi:hypothetical protein